MHVHSTSTVFVYDLFTIIVIIIVGSTVLGGPCPPQQWYTVSYIACQYMPHCTCVSKHIFVYKIFTLERKHSPTTLIIFLCVFTQYSYKHHHHHHHHNQFQNVSLKSKPPSATRTKASIQTNCGKVPFATSHGHTRFKASNLYIWTTLLYNPN